MCGNWSANVTGLTSDGIASPPTDLKVHCNFQNHSDRPVVAAEWSPPVKPNGMIFSYTVELNGVASYRSGKNRVLRNETYGPKAKTVLKNETRKAEFDTNIPLNTYYTVKVSATTRNKKPGTIASASCYMPRSTPQILPIFWGNFRTDDTFTIKMYIQELSERNGPICGYRVYLVRLPQNFGLDIKYLPDISKLNISTYHEVHAEKNTLGGAYIAETFSSDLFQNEIILGDGHSIKNDVSGGFGDVQNSECRKLLNGFVPPSRRSSAANSIGPIRVTTEDPLDGTMQ